MRITLTSACSRAWKTRRALPLVPASPIPEMVIILISLRVETPNTLSVCPWVATWIRVPFSSGAKVLSKSTGIFFSIAGRIAGG